MATPSDVARTIADEDVKFVDLRFTDTRGKEQHSTVPARIVDERFFETGKAFDGSSIAGWRSIDESDMVLMPEPAGAVLDPFRDETTLILRCDVLEPATMQGYERDPRTIGKRAEAYLRSSGAADSALFGPEPEFFIFDDVRFGDGINHCFYEIRSSEGAWDSEWDGNRGHRIRRKGGYFPVPPADSLFDVRSAMCLTLERVGLAVEMHHHEVGTGGQAEIGTGAAPLVEKADQVQMLKYVVHNVADSYGMTATFMPKPMVGDNGNGMHVHQSLSKDGRNLFPGDRYGGLSQEALWYVGGVFRHARALNAFTNSGTNSYKRLVPGFEAPTLLAYSVSNRSASVRIPFVHDPDSARIEVRFPDSSGNPYLAFAAMMMAGIDGIRNRIEPGDPIDRDLYALSREEERRIPHVCATLAEALDALDGDRGFLTEGGVFSDGMIDAYVDLKMEEVDRMLMATHPCEFDMYYSL